MEEKENLLITCCNPKCDFATPNTSGSSFRECRPELVRWHVHGCAGPLGRSFLSPRSQAHALGFALPPTLRGPKNRTRSSICSKCRSAATRVRVVLSSFSIAGCIGVLRLRSQWCFFCQPDLFPIKRKSVGCRSFLRCERTPSIRILCRTLLIPFVKRGSLD